MNNIIIPILCGMLVVTVILLAKSMEEIHRLKKNLALTIIMKDLYRSIL